MTALLVVDASCDLPETFISSNNIGVLPIQVVINGQSFIDDKNPLTLRKLYRDNLLTKGNDSRSVPWTDKQMSQYLLTKTVPDFDSVLIQTVSRSRSKIFDNANLATFIVNRDYTAFKDNPRDPFSLRVQDSGTMFSGQGLLAIYTQHLIKKGVTAGQLRKSADTYKNKIWAYAVPKDIDYVRQKIKQRGDKGISWIASTFSRMMNISPILCNHKNETFPVGTARGYIKSVNKMLDAVCQQIQLSLTAPYIVISIAGYIDELEQFDQYQRLQTMCQQHNIKLYPTMMGLTGATNLGPGTVTIAFSTDKPVLGK